MSKKQPREQSQSQLSADAINSPSRRQFLKSSGAVGAGLVVGFQFSCGSKTAPTPPTPPPPAAEFVPNAFVRIAPDNSVTVISKHIEFGQGTYTGLATILAEELDADWSQIRVESAPADASRYNNLFFGPAQGTGGSTAIPNSWQQLRQAGATARAMLVTAAAQAWAVPAAEITVQRGRVTHQVSGQNASFGELATAAAQIPVPEDVKLKDPKDFKLIGTSVPRVDVPGKSRGETQFTMDFHLPDMLTAIIARPPNFGAKLVNFDSALARKVRGVVQVVAVPSGVAVLARGFWAAKKGRDALRIEWDTSSAETRSSSELLAEYLALAGQPGNSARNDGDASAAITGAAKVLSADFEFPFLAHAPMEPLDCVIRLNKDSCDLWYGCQSPTRDQSVVASILGLPPGKVHVHTLLAGGSFGRRATPNSDVASEAANIVKAIGGKAPVKLVWTREDDIRGGRYRPMYFHRLRAGLDKNGNIMGWHHRVVGQSIARGTPYEPLLVKNGIDPISLEGAMNLPYAIPNIAVELSTTDVQVPVLWWRSVGHTHTAFSTEVFIDELARAGGHDPVELRRKLLKKHRRLLGVLDLAAEKSGWGKPMPKGKARGIAVHKSFNSFVAEVAEISLGSDGMPVVERVVCAVDCGIAINPDNIAAQVEGGVGFGLGAALHNELVLHKGRVKQSNFHDYRSLRIHEMPRVEVHIVQSSESPTGIGEPGVPPIAPAVANAYRQLTGRPVRRLPFRSLLNT
ncbi:MAG: molybdopterin-dependent oxidoreductase [Proteobacteria bacterium]|nr:molybdopterin-dependent oxidoreductase [Pseudomonadota bacterium]